MSRRAATQKQNSSTAETFTPAVSGLLQRKCACGGPAGARGDCAECDQEKVTLQRCATHHDAPSVVPPVVDDVLRSSGQPLDGSTRATMESRFGHNFGQVRVHADPRAAESAQAVGAQAYTVGRDIVFGAGQYATGTTGGINLLAHELTHVVQQGHGGVQQAQSVSHPDDSAEVEAARIGNTFSDVSQNGGSPVAVAAAPAAAVMRADPPPVAADPVSPLADNDLKPQKVMQDELGGEVKLFANAKVVLAWIKKQRDAAAAASTPPSQPATGTQTPAATPGDIFYFDENDLFADTATMKKISPVPKSAEELAPTLQLMVDYGVLRPKIYPTMDAPDPKHPVVIDKQTGAPATADLDQAGTDITKFSKDFDKRVKRKDPLSPVVSTGLMPTEWSSDTKQVTKEKGVASQLEAVKAQLDEFIVILKPIKKFQPAPILRATSDTPVPVLDKKSGEVVAHEIPVAGKKKPVRFVGEVDKIERVSDGTDAATVKRRESLEKIIKITEKDLKEKGRYRTFSDEMLALLERLRKKNVAWSAGTYAGHSWGEFSADIFLKGGYDKTAKGFYDRDNARKFFEDLNAAADEDDGVVGKIAWRALYNDDPLAAEINKKYGARRILHVPGHGPDNLHIHLDITPVNLVKDEVTGYDIEDGRVRLLDNE